MINLYYGPVVNPQSLSCYSAHPRCLIAVGSDGNIIWIEEDLDPAAIHGIIDLRGLKDGEYTLVQLDSSSGEFLMPGLVDTHVHACQFPNLGIGGDRELLDWLIEYVFPAEANFKSTEYAKRAYGSVVDRCIASGTTTSCYYGSLHLEATKILADIVQNKGQRAFVGKCNMDWNCPGYYIEQTPEQSLEETKILIDHIQGLPASHANEPLVHPIITPRFALSCSDKLLIKLGELAASHPGISIQTHISENRKEVEEVKRRFGAESYAAVYDQFGLLRCNTILGHGVWLTEDEMKLIAKRGAGVAHCPTSNFYLSSGMARVGLLLDHGVKVGLGTDVSGGYNPSVLYAIQMASTASKMVAVQAELDEERRQKRRERKRCKHGKHEKHKHHKHSKDVLEYSDSDSDSNSEDGDEGQGENEEAGHHRHHRNNDQDYKGQHDHCGCHDPHHPIAGPFANKKLQVATLLYLATLGGAHVCCLQDRIGSFAVGKAFDALHVSLDNAAGNPAVWGEGINESEMVRNEKNVKTWLERFLFCGDNRNIRQVFVQGLVIGGTARSG